MAMISDEKFQEVTQRVMATVALAGVKPFEEDVALLLIELKRGRAAERQLQTAQEVIEKHVGDQIEGLHCVNCVAEPDQRCDCPMLAPIFEAMKGFEPKTA